MIECVTNPLPECGLGEENILLPENVQLRIADQDPRGHELIEDTDNQRRQEREDDVIHRQRPGFIGNLAREVVQKGILSNIVRSGQ